jgi:iron(III) transport system substrate-binding protein
VYVALDREFAEPILREFEQQSGIRVLAKYDVESTKTVGLVNAIIQERERPRCDLFWNNEVLHTLRLQKLGMLTAMEAPSAAGWPPEYCSQDKQWYGFAARARVLIVNTDLVPLDQRPDSIEDLVDKKWQGKVGVAKPLFGTTASHAAVLFATWGEEPSRRFFHELKQNAQVLSGNKQVASAVGRGQLAFGLTDTDDAIIERDQGRPVAIVFPDQDGIGTLFIPNSLCLIRGSRHPELAAKLVDFLLRPRVEEQLAAGSSAQFPVNPKVTKRSRAAPNDPVRWQSVDFSKAADAWESAASFLREEFASAD